MNAKIILYLFLLLCFAAFFQPVLVNAAPSEEKVIIRATVTESDCRKCHEGIVLLLRRRGEAHSDLCLQCHQGHPPADMEIIPSCSRCHQGEKHFELDNCLSCHRDPHSPLHISLTKKITGPCLSCHDRQIVELRENPSIHSLLACTACHYYHGQLQPCGNCHLPHSDTMEQGSCGSCHKPHMPLVVSYGDKVKSEDCGSCHVQVYDTIAATWSRHRNVECVRCHPGRHGTIKECRDCHGVPHNEDILGQFRQCGQCHDVAHDLWAFEESVNKFVIESRRNSD